MPTLCSYPSLCSGLHLPSIRGEGMGLTCAASGDLKSSHTVSLPICAPPPPSTGLGAQGSQASHHRNMTSQWTVGRGQPLQSHQDILASDQLYRSLVSMVTPGETASPWWGHCPSLRFGNDLHISNKLFVLDAGASGSKDMKVLRSHLQDIRSQIVSVSVLESLWFHLCPDHPVTPELASSCSSWLDSVLRGPSTRQMHGCVCVPLVYNKEWKVRSKDVAGRWGKLGARAPP